MIGYMSDKMKGNILLLLTAIMWGSGFISSKFGNAAMPPATFNAVRQLMAAAVLAPVALRSLKKSGYLSAERHSYDNLRYRKAKLLKAGLCCGFCLLIGSLCQQIGLLTVSAGKSGFITSIYIVFTPLFAVILGSKVSRRTVLCIALAIIGFALMSLKGGLGGATTGDWLTLLSAAGFAAQIVAVNCFVDNHNAVLISQMQFFVSGLTGLGAAAGDRGHTGAAVSDARAYGRRIYAPDHRPEVCRPFDRGPDHESRGCICHDLRRNSPP